MSKLGKNLLSALREAKKKSLVTLEASLLKKIKSQDDCVTFDPADYVDNPIALARIQSGVTQKDLAILMGVTQTYISKIENQERVTLKLLKKAKDALVKARKKY